MLLGSVSASCTGMCTAPAASFTGHEPHVPERLGHLDSALLAAVAPDIAHRAHVCGPLAMMGGVKAALVGLGLPDRGVIFEAHDDASMPGCAGLITMIKIVACQ